MALEQLVMTDLVSAMKAKDEAAIRSLRGGWAGSREM